MCECFESIVTDWSEVLVLPEQGQVVLKSLGVKLGVTRDYLHLPVLVRVRLIKLIIEVILSHPQEQLVRVHAAKQCSLSILFPRRF